MRTIFITSFNPFISRNILATDVFKILKIQPDLRIIIFVPDYKIDYFKSRYTAPNVIIEGIPAEKFSRQDVLSSYLASSLVNSQSLAIHKREKLLRDKNIFKFVFSWILRKLFGKLNLTKRIVRFLDLALQNNDKYRFTDIGKYFEKYQPDLLFAADVYHNDDVHFLAEAKRRGVLTVGMVRSWDNITTKGMFRIRPDKLIVNNEIIKNEAVKWNGMEVKNIFVSGVPQYDRYINGKLMPREDFFQKLGFDPKRKLILFSPFGGRFYKYDWQIIEILKELGEQIFVRLTPNDAVNLSRLSKNPSVFIDQPGHQFRPNYFRDTELDEKDSEWLADSLYHSDVVVACGASIAIDAAVFNKPAILIYFDGFKKDLPYIKSAKRWLDFDHGRQVWQSGGARPVRSREELISAVKAYLAEPLLDQGNRQKIALQQCSKLDGQSGKRLAEFMLTQID